MGGVCECILGYRSSRAHCYSNLRVEESVKDPGSTNMRENKSRENNKIREILLDYIRHPEFKRLLNQVMMAQKEKGFSSVTILSEFPQEGRTFFISALALGYATYLDKKVLIMDTISQTKDESFYFGHILGKESDLIFSYDNDSDAKGGVVDLIATKNLCRRVRLEHEGESLDVIRQDSLLPYSEEELYENVDFRIREFINTLKQTYDLILLDTCPLSRASKFQLDPMILAKQAEASILLTSQQSVSRQRLSVIKNELELSRVEILGTIYNEGAAR